MKAKKPNKQQRKTKRQKLGETQDLEYFIANFCEKTGFECPGFENKIVSTLLLLLRDWNQLSRLLALSILLFLESRFEENSFNRRSPILKFEFFVVKQED